MYISYLSLQCHTYIIQVKILIVLKKANSNAHMTQPGLITTYCQYLHSVP